MSSQTHHVNRGRAGFAPQARHLLARQLIGSRHPRTGNRAVRRADHALKGKTDVSITVKPAILPAAVFITVEIVLVAETISVILLRELDPRNPGAVPIAILLSVALLANLGVVCSVAAAIAADSVRRSDRARARALISSFTAVSAPAGETESTDCDVAGAGLSVPACSALPRLGPARPTDSADRAVGPEVSFPAGS